jgi:hypothetical protein
MLLNKSHLEFYIYILWVYPRRRRLVVRQSGIPPPEDNSITARGRHWFPLTGSYSMQ